MCWPGILLPSHIGSRRRTDRVVGNKTGRKVLVVVSWAGGEGRKEVERSLAIPGLEADAGQKAMKKVVLRKKKKREQVNLLDWQKWAPMYSCP